MKEAGNNHVYMADWDDLEPDCSKCDLIEAGLGSFWHFEKFKASKPTGIGGLGMAGY